MHRDPWADVVRVMAPYNAEGVSANGLTINVHAVRAGFGAAAHLERAAVVRLRDALTGWLDETADPDAAVIQLDDLGSCSRPPPRSSTSRCAGPVSAEPRTPARWAGPTT